MEPIPNHVHTLFAEIGPATDSIDTVSHDPETSTWTIGFDDDSAMLLEWDGELARLIVHALLGTASESSAVRVYRAVLGFNSLWRQNGGSRIGLVDNETGELALIVDVPAQDLSLEQLQRALAGVKSVAASWARFVANPSESDQFAPTEPIALSQLA